MVRSTPLWRVRVLWSIATLFLLSLSLDAWWAYTIRFPGPFLVWLFRHPAVEHEQTFYGPSCESSYWVDAFSCPSMCLVVLFFVASHVAPCFMRARRTAPILSLRFRDGLSYREPAPTERVVVNVDALRAASAARAELVAVWAVALSLGIALIGCHGMWGSAVVGHCCGGCGNSCWRSGNPAEYLAYYGVALLCLLSHAPRMRGARPHRRPFWLR
jgi:hypothetical protein